MPKARWSFGVRPTSKRSACGKTSSSGLAEPYQTVSLSPSRIGWARRSASRVAVRRKYMTGETQRSISSTAVGMRDGSASSRRRSSGCCIRASMPPEIRLRVVCWREVGLDLSSVGDTAGSVAPLVKHLVVGASEELAADQDAFERKLYVIRRVAK